MHLTLRRNPSSRNAVLNERVARLRLESLRNLRKMRHHQRIERPFNGSLALQALIRKTHSVRRQHSRQRMNQYILHAELLGNETRVLTRRAAKALQGEFADIVALLEGHLLDGVCHVGDGDAQKSGGYRPRIACRFALAADVSAERGKAFAHERAIDRQVAAGTEDMREMPRLNLAHTDVGIGHGERTAAPITRRARIGAGALGTDTKACAVKAQN